MAAYSGELYIIDLLAFMVKIWFLLIHNIVWDSKIWLNNLSFNSYRLVG